MKWLLNTTVGKATFSTGRRSRLVFRSCQQPRELAQGRQDAGKGTRFTSVLQTRCLLQGSAQNRSDGDDVHEQIWATQSNAQPPALPSMQSVCRQRAGITPPWVQGCVFTRGRGSPTGSPRGTLHSRQQLRGAEKLDVTV